jgi:tetratricopeptide (TPR) repeat protein
MGEVYRARDTKLDRDVAIKVLPEAFVSEPERLARFEREAKVLASLNHPSIGQIYGLEESGGVQALVLELVEGPTLADRIGQGPMALDEALTIANQIAEALENLAGQATAVGDLPRALDFRERRERLNRAQGIASGLAYDLTNRAELLLRLGRFDEADALLGELADGIAKGVEAYQRRAARAQMLRALHAALAQRFDLTVSAAAAVPSVQPPTSTNHYAAALLAYAEAKRGRRRPAPAVAPTGAPDEVTYWRIMAAFAAREDAAVLGSVTTALNAGVVSSELEWRLAALGAAAATRMKTADQARALRARAQQALDRVRDRWKEHARAYEERPDLVELRRAAGLTARPTARLWALPGSTYVATQ